MEIARLDKTFEYEKLRGITRETVDARTFSEKRKKLLEILYDSDAPNDFRIEVGQWFFRKIYMNWKFDEKGRKEATRKLVAPIKRSKNILLKGTYLNYTDVDASSKLAETFYFDRFKGAKNFVLQLSNDIFIVKYVESEELDDDRLVRHFLKWIRRAPTVEQQSNILDVLLLHYSSNPEVKEVYKSMRFSSDRKDVFGDQQNVHDEDISKSCMQAAMNLMKYLDSHPISDDEKRRFEDDINKWVRYHLELALVPENILNIVMTKFTLDRTTFGVEGYRIVNIWMALLKFIRDQPNPGLFYPRVVEECREMKDLCSSGYVERGINVLQGLPGCENFSITISERKATFALLSYKISSNSKSINPDLLEGSYTSTFRKEYVAAILKIVNTFVLSGLEPSRLPLIPETLREWFYGDDPVPDYDLEFGPQGLMFELDSGVVKIC